MRRRKKNRNISELTSPIQDFLFQEINGLPISKFLLKHEGKKFEIWVQVQPDGGDITIQTDDIWSIKTETWLQNIEGKLTKKGIPVAGELITYLVRHE